MLEERETRERERDMAGFREVTLFLIKDRCVRLTVLILGGRARPSTARERESGWLIKSGDRIRTNPRNE